MALTATSFMDAQAESVATKKTGINYLSSNTISRLNHQFQQDAVAAQEAVSNNNGGFFGGLGYMGEKIAVGFMSSIEGIWDYAAGGLAKLFGADDWAEQQFANDWFGDWYSHPEEWFNPSGGWQTAGDIAGGIGTSLPAIASVVAAAAVSSLSAGTLSPVAAGLIGAGVAGFGAAGTATKQAYKETGQLTGKEFGYGALTGFTEGALEGVTTALSMGTGQVINSVAKSFAKETTKTVAKQTVIKTLAKGFIGEAFEEGMAEILDPVWQRLTYNPEAQNATPQEVAYAAFVGGMSGMLMSGGNALIDSGNSFLKGNSLVGKGLDAEVIGLSQQLSEFEGANATGDETFQTIAQTYADLAQSLATTDGKVVTVTQKKLLGDLHRANTVAVFKPMIARSAANIVNNAEVIAQRLNEYGYKTTDGTPITFTAEQIREGVDTSNPTSFSDALKNNGVLRTLAIADTTGHLVMDTARFEQATLMGKRLASQVDLNRFIETATPSEISAVSQALGIENWATLDVDTFNQKITSFVENGGVQQYADRRATVQSIQAIPAETARPMPKMVNLRQDGSVRYSDGSTQIAITRQGDAYTVYDYASGHLSKNMTRSEVNKLLRDYNTQQADITAGARAQMEAESELRRQAEELDTYARQNITDYSKLSAPNQSMIRKVIREGRAKGMSDEDVLAYAKISAHAGIDISFDKQATFRGHDEEGNEKYADGFYDPKTNRIVVNPDSKRTHERLLLHELDHAIRQFLGADGVRHAKVFRQALEGVSPEIAQRIAQAYQGVDSSVSSLELTMDETNAYYAEEILSNRHTLERLVEAEPSLKDKILSFFKGASEDYKSVPKLSRAARSYYKTYKKLFDEFAERNFQNNATEAQTTRLSGEVSDARFSLQFADHIADNQRRFVLSNNVALTQDELERAIDQTAHMVELMSRYKDILPADTVPKKTKATLVKNGSYDISVENTTICVRTLAYNSFVEMVSEKIGRPLTQMESFLVSQKLYDIAKEPQCLYCYVSLDRKAYNDMVLKYIDQRERAIEAYERAGRPDITSESHPLYQEYLAGRKATKPQWKRYTSWIEAYKNGEGFLTTQDVATESRRAELARTGTPSQKAQLKDMTDYAQNASQAKKQSDYVAYYDDILRLSAPVVRNLNKHYGLRWYSFSDYSGAFIVENMQQITDASIRGLKGLAYTKDADFVRIFAPTGMNINVSVFVKENADGTFSIDPKQSANATVEELISLREAYPNVGVVATATSDTGVEWALAQGWTDVVIPFHIVRTGSNVADFYKWKNFTFEQSDTVADQNLWDAYVDSVASSTSARKKVSKTIYPSEHQNNRETYLRLIEERGLKPRFSSFLDNPNYMKLVNETRQSEAETVALKPVFDVDAAEAAFQKFVDKGGYYEGWYNDGIDVESEAETVAQDVLAGKKANEVSYGRQDIDAEGIQRGRKSNREHGRRFALQIGDTEVSTKGRYQLETDSETLLRDISEQNNIERFMPEGLSSDFLKAIRRSNGFAPSRLYRGMEAAEMDYIIENGFIKSNSSYNFANQQDQTRFSPRIQTALSYATGFAPAGIREKFFEQGLPAYIVEVGNYSDLNFINEDTEESYTKKNIDTKYITRVIELTYDAETNKVKARDVQIDGMNQAEGELLHGVPSFVQDKVTGTILYEHQDTEGYEDGKYISEKNPDILFDYDMVEANKGMAFDYNGYLGISGDPANLVPYKADGRRYALDDSEVDNAPEKLYNEITLSWAERHRLESEALTWDSGRRNQLRVRTLSNGIVYKYVIDDESNVHIYDRALAENIHERGTVYDNTNRKEPNRLAEELRAGQRDNHRDLGSSEDGRKQAENDRRALFDDIGQGKVAERARSTHGRAGSYGKKKVVRVKFDEGGSGHGVEFYSDGSSKRFALPLDEASGENYRNLVKEINDENNLGTEERNLSAEDIERLERIFDSDIVTDAEDRKLYARALRLIGGYSEVTLEDGSESLTVKVVDPKYYTKEMLRTERANTHAEYQTRFFIDYMTFADGEEYNVMGLADTDERIAYAQVTEKEAPLRKIMHGFSEEIAHFTEEESSVSAISRHERLHLLLRDWIFTDARAVLDAADDLRQLIDAEDGRYAKTFEKVNYWYQRKLHQNGYRFSDYSQEIACDLYSGALVMNDSKIQELVERHIREIDVAIEGSQVDGVRYALDVDSEGTQLTEAQQEFFKDSKVRDSKGRLLVMYHGTTANFNTFKKGDVGFHFGTKAAARGRVGYGKSAIMKRVHLNITNPIVFEEDLGSWDADYRLTQELFERDILTRKEVEQVLLSDDKSYRRPTEKANRKLVEVLLQKGYDGIAYSNTFETKKPTTSYIAFQSNQAKVVENETPTSNSDIRYALSETRGSIMTEVDPEYKPTVQDKVFSGWTAIQIAFTNAQAGIETVGKKYGVGNIESLVQAARSGGNQAEEMIAGNQYRIGADTKTYQGEGLEQIFRPIARQGEEVKGDFFDYLFNYHNMSRMTLEQRSMAEQQTRLEDLKKKVAALNKLNKRIEKLQADIKALGRTKKDMETKRGLREELATAKAEAKALKKEATELEKVAKAFVPLENKPVLGTTDEHGIETVVTAEQSEAIVKKYEEAHPEFKGVAEKVWAFLQNLNQYRVDTGLISQDTFDYLAKLYPHYVPTYRTGATKGIGAIEGKYNLKVKTTIKTAKGSTKNLLPPDVMIARQVMETVRAGRINQLANALYEGAQKSGDTTYIEIVSRERMSDEAIADLDPTELRPKNNEVVFFRDGERITMRVSKEIFAGFNAFNPEVEIHNPLVNGARAINNGFKRLVTSLNPAFLLRNTIRDVQDAGINTRYGKTFLKNYARATYEISHNGKLWQLYKAMGGFSSSVFDFEKGFSGMQNKWGLTKAEGNLLQRTLQGVENANAFVEQLPRLAEFISSIEAGNTAEQAILDSADVTTNFARMGNITKVLNRTLIPFLNPSIQGCSKMIRNITSIRSAREFASLALKAALVGVAPMVLNMLMYEDDEDYKNLRDADKENNFLFKVGDTFVKIPRGRVASVIGGLVNRSKTTIEGEDADWAGYVKNIMQQVTPVDSMSRTIFSPFSDVANNITWYGSAIEGRQFENTAPKDRYDENTSSIAIAIGQLINYSPKKIHYLLDQYSGVIGDFILPATTAKAEKDFLSGNFTLDPATSNRLSTDFYEMYDQAQYAKTAGDDTAAYQVRYLNKVKSAISDMYKQKSEIQNNPDLSNAEKLQQTRVVQLLINEAYKTALQDFELYTKAIEATAGMEDENLRFTEATRLMYGAERALSEYNDDVYAKCQMLNKAGVDYEVLYSYYFTVRGITSDKDYEGNTISGSKRKKVVASIKGMNISVDQKLLLICASGYALQDNDLSRMTAVNAKKRLLRYILNLKGATQTEKTELAEMCGFEVKNGRVVTKSVFSLG